MPCWRQVCRLLCGGNLPIRITQEIFLTGCKTVQKLTRMAKHHNQTVERIELGESKVRPEPGGSRLRSNAKACCRRAPRRRARPAFGCTRLASPFDEREHAAAYIRRKVRDEGARCRDFVVAARDIEPRTARSSQWAMARHAVPVLYLAEKPDLLCPSADGAGHECAGGGAKSLPV